MVFLRMQLAGALNLALVDFTWPPKAYTYIPDDAPQNTSAEQSFGVFDLEYNPKPSAEVAARYYADSPQISLSSNPNQLQFQFSRYFVPGSNDPRKLSVAFDSIKFLDEAGNTLLSLDVGTDEARPYLGSGFFEDEGVWGKEVDNFAWAGGEKKQAFVNVDIPAGTHSISLTLNNQMDNMHLVVLMNGIPLQDLLLKKSWKEYTVDLKTPTELQAGMNVRVYGRLNLAIADGTVNLQTSDDGVSWQDTSTTAPTEGYFSGDIPLEQAGKLYVRAIWSGNAIYQEAVSEPHTLEIAPLSSALLLENSPESLAPGTTVQINGRLEPSLAGETISIKLESPDRSTIEQIVQTIDGGSFSAEISVAQTGSWSLQVSWAGNSQ